MEIKVLGTGCAKCKALEATVRAVVAQMGLDAQVSKVEDIEAIMDHGVMTTPALVVGEKVVSQGRLLSESQVKKILDENR